ncbi:MAG: sulfite reductase, ferredoxin dependent, partial [Geitlerinemataceae cyanobacterium]
FKKDRKLEPQPESFGDFCDRVGFEALREFSQTYEPMAEETPKKTKRKERHRIRVHDEVYAKLKAEATRQDKQMIDLATEALNAYLDRVE